MFIVPDIDSKYRIYLSEAISGGLLKRSTREYGAEV